jgi:hypothetical protein
MSDLMMDIGKGWLEWVGRQKPAPKYNFQDNEIVSPGYPKDVSDLWKALYLRLHPTHYAVAISPDGQKILLQGGYNILAPGLYNIHYIDKQDRVNHLPRVTETTSDGYQVAIILSVTYRVQNPLIALDVQNAVDTLLRFIQSDLRDFIRSHTYDEIMGEPKSHKFENEAIINYIKDQHRTRHNLSKLFFIADVIVQEKTGDPRVMQQRERSQSSQREIAAKNVLQDMNQELTQKVAIQDRDIQRIRNSSELERQKSNQEIDRLRFENERMRADFQNRQDNTMRAMDAIAKAFASPAFLRDPQVAETVWKLFASLGISRPQTAEPASGTSPQPTVDPAGVASANDVDSLTDTLLSLLARKRT